MHFFRSYINNGRSVRIFALTLIASAVVTGITEYQSGTLEPWRVFLQSVLISALVTVVLGLTGGSAGESADSGRADRPGPMGPLPSAGSDRVPEKLEEQGITIKLLELIALGDRYGNTFSVAMIGIDHLDEAGGHYDGRATGELLDEVGSALAHTLRMPDRVGEYDYGTYLVVLPETTLPGAIQIAERLRAAIARVDIAVSHRVHIHTTASVGVTSYRRGDDLQSMLDRAAKALREAQNQGRNRVLPDMAA